MRDRDTDRIRKLDNNADLADYRSWQFITKGFEQKFQYFVYK